MLSAMENDLKSLAEKYASVCARIAVLYDWDEPDFVRFSIEGDEVIARGPTQGSCAYDDSPWIDAEEYRFALPILLMTDEQFMDFLPEWREQRRIQWAAEQERQKARLVEFQKALLAQAAKMSEFVRNPNVRLKSPRED